MVAGGFNAYGLVWSERVVMAELDIETTSPRARFFRGFERFVRVWFWVCILALIGSILGLSPTWMSVLAFGGVIWIPIAALVLWGRWLDEIMHFRSDQDDGPR